MVLIWYSIIEKFFMSQNILRIIVEQKKYVPTTYIEYLCLQISKYTLKI